MTDPMMGTSDKAGGEKMGAAKAGDPRERAVDALMALAAVRDWSQIELVDIAAEAGLTLAELRSAFPSKGAILGAFSRRIDIKVLGEPGDELTGEPARERLFDVMMRRLDALGPYKAALKRMSRGLRAEPATLAALNGVALNSQRYMLASAGISTEDRLATIRLQGAVLVFARVMETWFDDDDPGLARTMARLDKELSRGETWLKRADEVRRFAAPFIGFVEAMGRAGRGGRSRKSKAHADEDLHADPVPADALMHPPAGSGPATSSPSQVQPSA